MCGIAGMVVKDSEAEHLPKRLRRMLLALQHRGPDDAGSYVSPATMKWSCGLAHTRLSILDLSAAGHQPMSSPDGRYHITFNGEIYNFRELRHQLEAAGEFFHTQTDTEVLLQLYLRKGSACVQELAGMFAFAVWDEHEQSLFLARDPLGIKPLYYCETKDGMIFASELRALLSSDAVRRRLSPAAVKGYLLYGSVQSPYTLVEGVRELPAGGWLRWKQGRREERKYFDIQFPSEPMELDTAIQLTRNALLESVQRHFVSDVPVGIFLSGGMDSTALLGLARHIGIKDIHTFSISFDSPELNEGDISSRTAAHFETEHHDLRLRAEEGKSLLLDFLGRIDQPSVDGFNTFCVSKWAHDCGAKVVLSGLGGDELFGGYQSFQRVPAIYKWGNLRAMPRTVRNLAGTSIQWLARSPRQRRLGSFLTGQTSLIDAYWAARGIFTPQEISHILPRYFRGLAIRADLEQTRAAIPPQPTLEDGVSYLEMTRYMRNQLLRDSDVMSMASGLELRVPFVDSRALEVLQKIPAEHRLRCGKQLLKESVPEIPPWVYERPKRGFTFPFEEWMRSEWQAVFKKLDQATPFPLETWYRRWSLFALDNFIERNQLIPDA